MRLLLETPRSDEEGTPLRRDEFGERSSIGSINPFISRRQGCILRQFREIQRLRTVKNLCFFTGKHQRSIVNYYEIVKTAVGLPQ
jgi:hypothetical protein